MIGARDDAAVHEALEEAFEDLEAGDQGTDALAFIRELRAKR